MVTWGIVLCLLSRRSSAIDVHAWATPRRAVIATGVASSHRRPPRHQDAGVEARIDRPHRLGVGNDLDGDEAGLGEQAAPLVGGQEANLGAALGVEADAGEAGEQ